MTTLVDHRAAAYAAGTAVDHFAWWCAEHCVQTVDEFEGLPLVLEDWQLDFMGEALAVDAAGRPVWGTVGLLVPRKNGKTTLLAAYALYHMLEGSGRPRVQLAAASKEQAGELYGSLTEFVKASPRLREMVHLREYVKEAARADGLPGTIKAVACAGGRLHGGNASLIICDELAQWETDSARKAWTALTTGKGARRSAQVFTITTAGDAETRDFSILGTFVDGNEEHGAVEQPEPGLTISRRRATRTLVYNYRAPVVDATDTAASLADIDAILAANPSSWITRDDLAVELARTDLPASDLLQYYGNVWASATDAFVSIERWKGLQDPGVVIADGAQVHIGIDGSRTYDTTATAWAARLDDGRIAVKTHVLTTRKDAPGHEMCPGGEIDFDRLEEFVGELFDRFDVVDGAYDPRYLVRSAQLLRNQLGEARLAAVEPTSKLMRDALAAFYEAAVDGRLVHDGDPVLARHVAATRADMDEKGWVVRKRKQSRPIDAVIAAALAVWRCEVAEPAPTPWVGDAW